MCGIAGIFDTNGSRPVDEMLLARMNQAQFHRGPDEGGQHVEPGVGLAHRRLSIIDLSSGHQPLFNEDGSVVIVFNGEIYNFQQLAKELAALGHTFRTHSDTEVIVHAWEQWGEDCVRRLRGMFAFAIWDRNRQTLFLARDRLGIKPLYYAILPSGQVVFGSELKALLVHTDLPREVDPRAVEDYFAYGYVPEPKTILRHAFKLPPGYTLMLRRGEPMPQPRQYWDVPFKSVGNLSEDEAIAELIERLREAVSSHMIADVPLGAFLSGGVDSSAVVAMMAGLSKEPVNTCSISFGDPRFDEARYAQEVAERYHTRHYVEQVDSDDYDLIDRLAALYDEPYADSSALPTYRVCELARKRVTVALSGDGGDENFAGYRRYRWHTYEDRLRSLLPEPVRKPLFGTLGKVYPKADWAPKVLRAKTTFEALARDSVEGYFHGVSVMSDAMRNRLFSDGFRRELQGYQAIEVMRDHARHAPEHPLSRVQYLDMKTYLVGDILTKVDRASMAHALEVRVPLLDHELVEWVSGLPPEMKLKGREGKHIFKKALEPHLSDNILYRPKMGFSVPLANWFRSSLRERVRDAVLGPALADSGIFDRDFLQQLVDQHQSGVRDHSAALWSMLMFEAFVRQVSKSPVMSLSATNLPLTQNFNAWRPAMLLTAVALLAVLGLFWQTALSMVDIWWRSETFAHGFLIAPISLWLIWRKRKELAALTPRPNPLGFVFMIGFSLLWLVSHLVDILVIEQFALVGVIIAAVVTLLGHNVAWTIAFPLGFLFLAVPVGEGLIPPMMNFTADFTVKALQLTGIPVYREGTFFEIPSGNWSVVEGCSGVRYLIASATLGFLYAYLTYRSLWRRAIFIALSVIAPIFANGMRAYMIVMIAHLSDMKLALGIDHYIYGWVFFGLVMILLFWVGSFWREDDEPVSVQPAPVDGAVGATLSASGNGINKKMMIAGAGVLAAIGIGPLAAHLYQGDTNESAHVTLHVPASAADWQASATSKWDWQPHYLGMTAQLQQTYVRGDQAASIYLAYYRNQRQDAELVNSQNVMIEQKHPVWSNIGEQFITIPLNGHSVQIRQTRLRSPGMNLLIWDWYWLDGTYTSNHYAAKLIEAKNKLLGGQRNAAGIVIATQYEEKIEPAAAVLRDVVTGMLPSIEASLNDASRQQ